MIRSIDPTSARSGTSASTRDHRTGSDTPAMASNSIAQDHKPVRDLVALSSGQVLISQTVRAEETVAEALGRES